MSLASLDLSTNEAVTTDELNGRIADLEAGPTQDYCGDANLAFALFDKLPNAALRSRDFGDVRSYDLSWRKGDYGYEVSGLWDKCHAIAIAYYGFRTGRAVRIINNG